VPEVEEKEQHSNSNMSEKYSMDSSDEEDAEEVMNLEQVDESSRNQFDGDGKGVETEKDVDMEPGENDNYSDEFSDDDESLDEEMDESEIDTMLEQGK